MPTANDIYVSRYTGTKWAESLGFLSISSTGLIGINSTSPAAQLQITANAAGTIGCIIKAAASQTADLTQWQNSSGTVLSVVTAAGNVGIGTTNPSQKLSVSGGSIIVTGGGSMLVDTNGTSLMVGTGSNTSASIGVSGSRAFFGYDGVNAVVQGVAAKGIKFNVNNGAFGSGTAMTIDTAGNVGIGTTAPGKVLEVNLGTSSALRLTYNDADGSAATYMDTTVSSVGLITLTAVGSAPAFAFNSTVRLKGYTVATLPAGTVGDTAYVTNALSPTFLTVLVGGGTVTTTCFFNGTNWVAQ